MEYMNCGSLDQVYKKTGNVSEDVAGKIGYCTLSGLGYLYDEHRIIHRGRLAESSLSILNDDHYRSQNNHPFIVL